MARAGSAWRPHVTSSSSASSFSYIHSFLGHCVGPRRSAEKARVLLRGQVAALSLAWLVPVSWGHWDHPRCPESSWPVDRRQWQPQPQTVSLQHLPAPQAQATRA